MDKPTQEHPRIVIDLVELRKRARPRPFQCYRCGRFVQVLNSGTYTGYYGTEWYVNYKCSKCGVINDGS